MFQAWAPGGVGEILEGSDLAAVLLAALADAAVADGAALADGDIVVVTSKVVGKSEGRVVSGERAEWIERESVRVVARRGETAIVRTPHGLTMAAAGIDASNVEPGRLVLLPLDPDASAARIRAAIAAQAGVNVGVLVSDTAGRAWRIGQTDIAIGAAGVRVVEDHRGTADGYGNPLVVTLPAVADELTSVAELVQGKTSGRPFCVIRGRADLVLPVGEDGDGARALVRPDTDDMFALGAREAVTHAHAGDGATQALFGARSSADDLRAALALVPGAGAEATAAIRYAHGWGPTEPLD
jgi:coenzyme F420-0:L-glutamate ligase/coenzyme F420-1:gamma-L-glutamate ligase